MERKLVKQGRNALTVTLPAEWIKNKGLKAGDTISFSETSSGLNINERLIANKKDVIIDLKNKDKNMSFHIILGRYIAGYDQIHIKHNNPKLVQEISKNLMGMVIDKHTSGETILRSIISVPEPNFKMIIRRAGNILLNQARTLEELSRNKSSFKDVEEDEKLLDYNLLYCFRYLNKYQAKSNSHRNFLLCATLESIGDQITEIARHINSSKKHQELTKEISKVIEEYNLFMFGTDFKKLYLSLNNFKNKLGKKTFIDGLSFALAEELYNNIGYLIPTSKL